AGVAEAGSCRDLLQRKGSLLQKTPRLVDPEAADQLGGRFVEVRAAPAAQRAGAHPDPCRDPLDGQRLVDVLENERRDVAQLGRLCCLALQRLTELRLVP